MITHARLHTTGGVAPLCGAFPPREGIHLSDGVFDCGEDLPPTYAISDVTCSECMRVWHELQDRNRAANVIQFVKENRHEH